MFGRALQAHRRRRGLTQEDLATMASLAVRTIREIEAGRIQKPRAVTVRLLANALDLRGTERDQFYLLAAPDNHLPTDAGGDAVAGLAAQVHSLRSEKRRLEAENEVLRALTASVSPMHAPTA